LKNCSKIERWKKTINRGHPLNVRITIGKETAKQIEQRETAAKRNGDYRLLRRITGLRMIESGMAIIVIATLLGMAEQTIRNWLHDFLQAGAASLSYRKPPGRPTRARRRRCSRRAANSPQGAAPGRRQIHKRPQNSGRQGSRRRLPEYALW
jgi:hypothetical protein